MATETGPDLTGAQAAVEALMDDECIVYDLTDPRDWVMDPVTLRLVPPPEAIVYSGRCKFKDDNSGLTNAKRSVEAGEALALVGQVLDLPLSITVVDDLGASAVVATPGLRGGMVAEVTGSRRDPASVGVLFTVTEPVYKTMAVKRSAKCERRDRLQ